MLNFSGCLAYRNSENFRYHYIKNYHEFCLQSQKLQEGVTKVVILSRMPVADQRWPQTTLKALISSRTLLRYQSSPLFFTSNILCAYHHFATSFKVYICSPPPPIGGTLVPIHRLISHTYDGVLILLHGLFLFNRLFQKLALLIVGYGKVCLIVRGVVSTLNNL